MKELERLRGGSLQNDGGALVVLRSVAGTVEPVLGVVPRHGAAQVRALAVRSDDPAGRVEEEEAALAKKDRAVVRCGELLEDLRPHPDGDVISKAFDAVDANEWSSEAAELCRGEAERAEKSQPQDRASPPSRDCFPLCSEPKHRLDPPRQN